MKPFDMKNVRRSLKGLFIVLLAFIACAAVSVATDAFCRVVGLFPQDGQAAASWRYAIPLSYRMIYGTAAAAFVAFLAPEPRWRYVGITGVIGWLLCLAGWLATKGRGPEFGPAWYSLALTVSVPLATFAGGWICLRRRPEARDPRTLIPKGTI